MRIRSWRHLSRLAITGLLAVSLVSLETIDRPEAANAASASPDRLKADKSAKLDGPKPETPSANFSNTPPPGGINPVSERGKVIDRTANTETVDNGDGTVTTKLHSSEVNKRDADGRWVPIDDSLVADNGRLKNRNGRLAANFAPSTGDGQLVTIADGANSLSFQLQGAKSGKAARTDQNKVAYDDVLDNTDVSYTVNGSQIKELITLDAKPSATPRIASRCQPA